MKEATMPESKKLFAIKSTEEIEVSVPLKERYAGLIRLVVSGLGIRMNCNYDEIEDLKLAVDEAFLIALKSGGAKKRKSIKLRFLLSKNDITSIFPVNQKQLDNDDISLFLIKGVTNKVLCEKTNGETNLVIVKKISKGGK